MADQPALLKITSIFTSEAKALDVEALLKLWALYTSILIPAKFNVCFSHRLIVWDETLIANVDCT